MPQISHYIDGPTLKKIEKAAMRQKVSIVKFHEGILITNNVKEFYRIKGLKIENWAK